MLTSPALGIAPGMFHDPVLVGVERTTASGVVGADATNNEAFCAGQGITVSLLACGVPASIVSSDPDEVNAIENLEASEPPEPVLKAIG